MNRNFCLLAFVAGLAAVAWIAAGYFGSHPLALTMTAIIAAVYLLGARELQRFHQATNDLAQALASIPDNLTRLGDWLVTLPPALQNPVRLRIEGERVGLPGPALTPYLVGLLVMLGMLGTFLGMVVTLNGAVIALESTTDLQTVRAALAAPIKGLGLAFGTSVAGVAASAMLGLMSSLCRRERLQTAQALDTRIATVLRGFSLVHQRQETFKALQVQAQGLPAVVEQLSSMMTLMEARHQQLNERLLTDQDRFYQESGRAYKELASAVDQSLKASLVDSARVAGDAIRPAVDATMAGIARETTALQAQVAATLSTQLDGLSVRFDSAVGQVAATWTAALAAHERRSAGLESGLQQSLGASVETFGQRASALVDGVGAAHARLQEELTARDQQRQAVLTQSLDRMAASLQREWQQAGAQTLTQQQAICRTLEAAAQQVGAQAQHQTDRTLAEITRLMDVAAAAPRAAAEVIATLREEVSAGIARDNTVLEERRRIMDSLGTLLETVNQAAGEQRDVIGSLVAGSAEMLERLGSQFTAQVGAESARMVEAATHVESSAVEVSSLSETLAFAVERFSESNTQMIAKLQRIEDALEKSLARSDEQLAYYVAQAREVIDLSILSQQRMVEDLQQFAGKPLPLASEVG